MGRKFKELRANIAAALSKSFQRYLHYQRHMGSIEASSSGCAALAPDAALDCLASICAGICLLLLLPCQRRLQGGSGSRFGPWRLCPSLIPPPLILPPLYLLLFFPPLS